MNYVVNISSTDNTFFGTGFLGKEISSFEDLKAALHKYATYKEGEKSYWQKEIKISFNTVNSIKAFKEEGGRQCKEQGFVNLLSAAAALKKDPFYGYEIIYRPGKWIDEQGKVFSFVLIEKNEIKPFYGKLKELLTQIGIEF